MSVNSYGKYPKKPIFLADLIALVLAWFVAVMIRYDNWADRLDPLYLALVISMCLIQIVIFFLIDTRRRSVYEMDPFENLIAVIRDRTLVIFLTVLYLYLTQRGEMSSRLVLGMLYVLSIIFDLIFRMLLKKSYLRKHIENTSSKLLEISEPYPDPNSLKNMISQVGCTQILVRRGNSTDEAFKAAIDMCSGLGIRTYAGLGIPGYEVKSGIACDIHGLTSIPVRIRDDRFEVFGVKYAVSRVEEAVLHVIRSIKELSGSYICFSNTHTLVMAKENEDYRNVLNDAAFTFADGTPIAKLQLSRGLTGVERVAGPDFMEHMFRDTVDGSVSHFFYGSSQETLDALLKALNERYPGINIKGMYSPPYRELTPEEDEEDIRRINESGADLIWIGLGAPKQEKWMAAHKGRIQGVMLGVGAGFDFHAGTIHRAPVWIQKIGMEWLYRLFQDPGRLFKRYFVTNTKFYIYRIIESISIIFHKKDENNDA